MEGLDAGGRLREENHSQVEMLLKQEPSVKHMGYRLGTHTHCRGRNARVFICVHVRCLLM